MAEYTQNYNLKKPAEEDFYNINDHNDNMDIIDSEIKKLEQMLENIETPVTSVNGETGDVVLTADDVGAETPAGAQAKAEAAAAAGVAAANAVQANLDAHKAENATDTQKGHIILASSSETELGTEATKAVTPAGLKEVLDKRPSLIDNRIPVPSGADMNDYITPGNYRILDMATAGTLINYPAPYGGTLEVWRYTPTFFIQRLTTSTTGVFYQRTCVNGVWSSWNMTYNTTNITVSTLPPTVTLAEGFQHQVY